MTLLGCKLRDPNSDQYYFQQLVMHLPHRKMTDLLHSKDEELPESIHNFVAFVNQPIADEYDIENLSDTQKQVLKTVDNFLMQQDYYNDMPEARDESIYCEDDDDQSEIVETNTESRTPVGSTPGHDWWQFILIKGFPGTGKSHALRVVILKCLKEDYRVAVATPTGYLQSTYRAKFIDNNFHADTIHGLFQYPVDTSQQRPCVNWAIGDFQVLIIDKISMVPAKIFNHVFSTMQQLHIRSVVLLCADQQQQQLIESKAGKIQTMTGVLQRKDFYKCCAVFNFLQQHRCRDPVYMSYL